MTKTSSELTSWQISEADFLKNLVIFLRSKDLSKLDLISTEGVHRSHSLLVENYEINVRRTPVYAYPKKWNRIFCMGQWVFEPGKYERYELDISENVRNKRQIDYARDCYWDKKLGNSIMQIGTMATCDTAYHPRKIYINRNPDIYEDMYVKQNAHLFYAARELYDILDRECIRRNRECKYYELPDLNNQADKVAARRRLMENLQRQL